MVLYNLTSYVSKAIEKYREIMGTRESRGASPFGFFPEILARDSEAMKKERGIELGTQ